jgi:glycosyltransferase involved in cell wall biosynthesis
MWGPGKLIVTVHDLIFRRYPEDYNPVWLALTRLTLPLVLRRSSMVIADSFATRHDIQTYYGLHPKRITVIYPGVDHQYPSSNHELADGASSYILCLGPWVRRKNLEVVMRAFSLLADDMPDLKLVVTGRSSSGMKGYTVEQLLGTLSAEVRPRVHLVGYVAKSELAGLVRGASLLAYPSRWEGFGLPPLEAMSAGVPVVASDTPAVSEVTAGAAMLVNPDDAVQWAEAMRRILNEPFFREELIKGGKKRSATFTWEKCARQTAELYHIVAGDKARLGVADLE